MVNCSTKRQNRKKKKKKNAALSGKVGPGGHQESEDIGHIALEDNLLGHIAFEAKVSFSNHRLQ